MANTLEDMLKPGEVVVWRESRERWKSYISFGAVLVPVLLVVVLLFILEADNNLYLLGGVLLCLCIIIGAFLAMPFGDTIQTLVTNRRLLLRRPSKEDEGIDTEVVLSLDQITSIDLLENMHGLAVEVDIHDGTRERLGELRNLGGFLTAFGQQVSLPGSFSIGRLDKLSRFRGHLSMAVLLFFIWAWMWLPTLPFFNTDGFGPSYFLGFVVVLVLAAAGILVGSWLVGHLTSLVAVLLMPRLATAEEAETWLNSKPGDRLTRWSAWKHPLYFKLASWRYGRAIRRRGTRGASHSL